MKSIIVLENPKDWPLHTFGAEVISAREYIQNPEHATHRGTKVFNLARTYKYQSMGYYVSLLAAARGHKPLPGISTMVDLRNTSLIRLASEELEDETQHALAHLQSDSFTLSIYFGRNLAKKYDRLAARLFRLFPAPLLRAEFVRHNEAWQVRSMETLAMSDVPDSHRPFLLEAAEAYFEDKPIPEAEEASTARFSLAILYDTELAEGPSDDKAIQRFTRAAERLDFSVEVITREEIGRLAEFDALFIRDTTNVNHYTFRFARRAKAEGLVVIDDPESILKCSNKVFLAELLTRAKIPIPKTVILHKDNIREALTVGLPCILKQPDSAFSRGVHKVETEEELDREAKRLLEKSELIIAQEFLPTSFDWRIGVIDREPLYVCRYHMAKSHWQIVKHEGSGEKRWGRTEAVPLWAAPRKVVQTALKAANLIGDGLYGIDMKEVDGKPYIIEINDNPDIVAGFEDSEMKDELYQRIMEVFLERVERAKGGPARR